MQGISAVTDIYNLLNFTNCYLVKLPLTGLLPTVTKSHKKLPKITKRYQTDQKIPKNTKVTIRYKRYQNLSNDTKRYQKYFDGLQWTHN